ncbi:MAG: ABC transporter ATP-binding protein [Synergistetes bacterium]|nr:ABC transporter ATP-binding protein [Synergistota bacterium]
MVELKGLSVEFEDFSLKGIDLKIEDGEFFVILGPSGAGKTVLLETIAGLFKPKSGKIFVDGVDITDFPPEKRGISIVYQDYALFPHLTVYENILFPLRFRKRQRRDLLDLSEKLIKSLKIESILDRYPDQISGGEAQRAALARALIVKPKLLLLDEPLSALDPPLRGTLGELIKKTVEQTKTTTLMVTHSFGEAMSMASRIGVIKDGKIYQVGKPDEVFWKPNSVEVAEFVGMKNLFKAEVKNGEVLLEGKIRVEIGFVPEKEKFTLGIRPEDIIIALEPAKTSARNVLRGEIRNFIHKGFFYEVDVDVEGIVFKASITQSSFVEMKLNEVGKEVYLLIKATAWHII